MTTGLFCSYPNSGEIIPVQRFGAVRDFLLALLVLSDVGLLELLLQINVALETVGVVG